MKDDNEDDLKNKEDLHIGGRHTALDIFRFAVFFFPSFDSKIIFRMNRLTKFFSSTCFDSYTFIQWILDKQKQGG